MSRASLHVSITGRVQGVGYRAFVEGEAVARGLSGWVRNRRDGSVEAVFRARRRSSRKCWTPAGAGRAMPLSRLSRCSANRSRRTARSSWRRASRSR